MLPRDERLTSTEFDRAFSRSQSVRHPLVVLRAHAREDGDDATRAAFVVPKKQGKATVRNRVRRCLRERYRLHPRRGEMKGCDLIFLSTPETGRATNEQLDAALDEVLRRARKKLSGNAAGRSEGKPQPRAAHPQRVSHSDVKAVDVEVATTHAEVPSLPNEAASTVVAKVALTLIRFYQRFISPTLPPSCRFLPTCSHYTYAAIERFGVARGLWLGTCRICRCNPFHPGGIDPVPEFFPHTFSIRKFEKPLSWRRLWSSKSGS